MRTRIGYVSQLGGADDLATGRENLILQGRLYGRDLDTVVRRTDVLIDLLDLSEFADRRAKTYSGGQRRRLDIALGIVHEPEVLFLDEPSTGLDPQNRANLWDHVRTLRDGGTTIFLTTHYLEEADALCDRLVIMDHGEIVIEGTPRDLKRQVAGESVVMEHPGRRRDDRPGPRPAGPAALRAGDQPARATSCACTWRTAAPRSPRSSACSTASTSPIRSVQLSEPTLDDVFLRQTGRSLRDTGLVTAEEGPA